jgi:hypothetical protein
MYIRERQDFDIRTKFIKNFDTKITKFLFDVLLNLIKVTKS